MADMLIGFSILFNILIFPPDFWQRKIQQIWLAEFFGQTKTLSQIRLSDLKHWLEVQLCLKF